MNVAAVVGAVSPVHTLVDWSQWSVIYRLAPNCSSALCIVLHCLYYWKQNYPKLTLLSIMDQGCSFVIINNFSCFYCTAIWGWKQRNCPLSGDIGCGLTTQNALLLQTDWCGPETLVTVWIGWCSLQTLLRAAVLRWVIKPDWNMFVLEGDLSSEQQCTLGNDGAVGKLSLPAGNHTGRFSKVLQEPQSAAGLETSLYCILKILFFCLFVEVWASLCWI